MRDLLNVQKQLLPDLLDVMKKRYSVLHQISVSKLIGRRPLASAVGMTERVLRAEVDFLKDQGLVEVETFGMRITDAGRQLLETMEPMMKELFGLSDLEQRIRDTFRLKLVVVVPGDSDESPYTKKELGRAGAAVLRKLAFKDGVIAVAGGSTMAEVAEHLSPSPQLKGTMFVPARGGLSENVELQANTIAATMAKRAGGEYRLLHVPEHLGEEAHQSLLQEPNVQEIVQMIRSTRIVVHGIGEAIVMARRRQVDEATVERLGQDGAIAEAFGYYFNRQGEVLHKMSTVGLQLEDIERTELVIAVAGGRSKGESIAAVLRFGHEDVLVTDEAAAAAMLGAQE